MNINLSAEFFNSSPKLCYWQLESSFQFHNGAN